MVHGGEDFYLLLIAAGARPEVWLQLARGGGEDFYLLLIAAGARPEVWLQLARGGGGGLWVRHHIRGELQQIA